MKRFRYAGHLLQEYLRLRDKMVSIVISRINLRAQKELAAGRSADDFNRFVVPNIIRDVYTNVIGWNSDKLLRDPEVRKHLGIRHSKYDFWPAVRDDVQAQINLDLSDFPERSSEDDNEWGEDDGETGGSVQVSFEFDEGYDFDKDDAITKKVRQQFGDKADYLESGEAGVEGSGFSDWLVDPSTVKPFLTFFKQRLRQFKIHLYDMKIEGQQEFSEW